MGTQRQVWEEQREPEEKREMHRWEMERPMERSQKDRATGAGSRSMDPGVLTPGDGAGDRKGEGAPQAN